MKAWTVLLSAPKFGVLFKFALQCSAQGLKAGGTVDLQLPQRTSLNPSQEFDMRPMDEDIRSLQIVSSKGHSILPYGAHFTLDACCLIPHAAINNSADKIIQLFAHTSLRAGQDGFWCPHLLLPFPLSPRSSSHSVISSFPIPATMIHSYFPISSPNATQENDNSCTPILLSRKCQSQLLVSRTIPEGNRKKGKNGCKKKSSGSGSSSSSGTTTRCPCLLLQPCQPSISASASCIH
jgi:hypothetical protein